MNEYLTTHEAAAILRCHEKTVRRMIGRGQIEASFVAGKYLIPRSRLPLAMPERPAPPPRTPSRKTGHFAALAASMDDAA